MVLTDNDVRGGRDGNRRDTHRVRGPGPLGQSRPTSGAYQENLTPVTGKPFCEVRRSAPEDIELALDARALGFF